MVYLGLNDSLYVYVGNTVTRLDDGEQLGHKCLLADLYPTFPP